MKSKTKNTLKQIGTITACVLTLILTTGICLQCFGSDEIKPSNWFHQQDGTETAGGMTIPNHESRGVALRVMEIKPEDYNNYGIVTYADSAYQVTATVKDANGATPEELQKVTYSMVWASDSVETLTDYVTMSTNGTTATFTCLQGFLVPITVTCVSAIDAGKSASLTLHYVRRANGVNLSLNQGVSVPAKQGNVLSVNLKNYDKLASWNNAPIVDFKDIVFDSLGTIDDTCTIKSIRLDITRDFASAFAGAVIEDSESGATSGLLKNSITLSNRTYSQQTLLCALYGNLEFTASNYAKFRPLISALENCASNVFDITIEFEGGKSTGLTFSLNVTVDPVVSVPDSIHLDKTELLF